MLPVHLEEVLYLLVNKHLWNERFFLFKKS